MTEDCILEKGSIVKLKFIKEEIIGEILEVKYHKLPPNSEGKFTIHLLSSEGFSYIIPTELVSKCTLVKAAPRVTILSWINKLVPKLFLNKI